MYNSGLFIILLWFYELSHLNTPFNHVFRNNGHDHLHGPTVYFYIGLHDWVQIAAWSTVAAFTYSEVAQKWMRPTILTGVCFYNFIGDGGNPQIYIISILWVRLYIPGAEKYSFVDELSAREVHDWCIYEVINFSIFILMFQQLFNNLETFVPFLTVLVVGIKN